jgi:hypothetical protein
MDALSNPYTPNAGAQPAAMLGRDDQLQAFELLLRRLRAGRTEQSLIVTGLRGVGKTALLGRFRKAALREGWVVIEREIAKHDDSQFRRALSTGFRTALFELSPKARWTDRVRRAAAVLKSFSLSIDESGSMTAGLDVEAAAGFADHHDLTMDLSDLLVSAGEAAEAVDRGIVLIFDEVQFLSKPQLEAIITAVHKTVQRELPVTFVAAGLPQIAELAGDAKSYSERLFKFPRIGNLSTEDARQALVDPAAEEGVVFDDDALDLAIEVTGRYPYFIQELGYAVWTVASDGRVTRADVESALPQYEAKLDESFFRVRLDRCTPSQVRYLRAMAQLGPAPQKAQDVAEQLGKRSTQVAPTRAELINMGLLFTPEFGYAAFTVPHFDVFITRAYGETG